MICYYDGNEYSDGAVICVNGGRYICKSGEWRDDGNCLDLENKENEKKIKDDSVSIEEFDGISITKNGFYYRLINQSDKEKIVTLRVIGSTTRSGKFYVVAKNAGRINYDIRCFADNEEGVVQIVGVENASFNGDLTAKEYLNVDLLGSDGNPPFIENNSLHHIYVAMNFGYLDENLKSPTAFLRYVLRPGRKIPLGNEGDKIKIFAWGTATIQSVTLL